MSKEVKVSFEGLMKRERHVILNKKNMLRDSKQYYCGDCWSATAHSSTHHLKGTVGKKQTEVRQRRFSPPTASPELAEGQMNNSFEATVKQQHKMVDRNCMNRASKCYACRPSRFQAYDTHLSWMHCREKLCCCVRGQKSWKVAESMAQYSWLWWL